MYRVLLGRESECEQIERLLQEARTGKSSALFLSPKTIETHLGRVYRKLGVRSRTELAASLVEKRVPVALA